MSTIKLSSLQNFDNDNDRNHLYFENFVSLHPNDFDVCDFQDASLEFHDMFSLNYNYDEVHFKERDDKERGIHQDNPTFKDEVLISYMYSQNYTSCVIHDDTTNLDQWTKIEEGNTRYYITRWWLYQELMLLPHPLNWLMPSMILKHPKGIISSSLCQKNKVWDSFTHSFEILFVSLIKLCVTIDVYLMEFFHKDSSCLGEHLNLVFIKRDMISLFDVDLYGIMRNMKVSMFLPFCHKEF